MYIVKPNTSDTSHALVDGYFKFPFKLITLMTVHDAESQHAQAKGQNPSAYEHYFHFG